MKLDYRNTKITILSGKDLVRDAKPTISDYTSTPHVYCSIKQAYGCLIERDALTVAPMEFECTYCQSTVLMCP